jgi:hypothetical protein
VVEMIKAYKLLIGKPETKNPFAKSGLRCKDISKKDLKKKEIFLRVWSQMWFTLLLGYVDVKIKLRVPLKVENF